MWYPGEAAVQEIKNDLTASIAGIPVRRLRCSKVYKKRFLLPDVWVVTVRCVPTLEYAKKNPDMCLIEISYSLPSRFEAEEIERWVSRQPTHQD